MIKLKSRSAPFSAGVHKQQAHALNTLTHIVQLLFPDGAQRIVAQDSRNDRCTVCRRVRVVSADNGFHLAERAIDGLIVSRNQRTGTYTLIVQTKVLG